MRSHDSGVIGNRVSHGESHQLHARLEGTKMVTILEFRQPKNDREGPDISRTTVKHPMGSSAEIIIFPGVRIERHPKPKTPSVAPKTRKSTKQTARRKS